MIDEVLYELRKTENSTSTLDLRWGLTAEVTEGRFFQNYFVELRALIANRFFFLVSSNTLIFLRRMSNAEPSGSEK